METAVQESTLNPHSTLTDWPLTFICIITLTSHQDEHTSNYSTVVDVWMNKVNQKKYFFQTDFFVIIFFFSHFHTTLKQNKHHHR